MGPRPGRGCIAGCPRGPGRTVSTRFSPTRSESITERFGREVLRCSTPSVKFSRNAGSWEMTWPSRFAPATRSLFPAENATCVPAVQISMDRSSHRPTSLRSLSPVGPFGTSRIRRRSVSRYFRRKIALATSQSMALFWMASVLLPQETERGGGLETSGSRGSRSTEISRFPLHRQMPAQPHVSSRVGTREL